MKFLLSLILLSSLFSCREAPVPPVATEELPPIQVQEHLDPIPSVPSQTSPEANPGHIGEGSVYTASLKLFPSASGFFTAKIKTERCSPEYSKKIEEVEKIVTAIFNSQNYRDEVLSFRFDGKTQFNWNEKMSNQQIYDHLTRGAEALSPIVNYQMDLTVVCYWKKWTSTIGYTYPSDPKIYANMSKQSNYSAAEIAENITHEWTHKMGFDHAVKYSQARDYTVPYGHSRFIIRKLAPLAVQDKLKALTLSLL